MGENLGHREIIGLTEKDAATLEEIEDDHLLKDCIMMHLH